MENNGISISKDFEDFLYERLTGGTGEREGGIVPDALEELDPIFEKTFTDAGILKETQEQLDLDAVYVKILEQQEAIYSKGVKDGAQLQLHLLGKALRKKKIPQTYPNLKAEMARNSITTKNIAEVLDMSQKSVNSKITGLDFSIDEAVKIRDTFFPEIRLDELFAMTPQGKAPASKEVIAANEYA